MFVNIGFSGKGIEEFGSKLEEHVKKKVGEIKGKV